VLGNILNHVFSILIEQWIVFNYQEAVVVLFQYGHELETGEGSTDIHVSDIAVQAAEDVRIVSADEKDLVSLKIWVAVNGIYQHLRWGDQDVECLRWQGDGRMQFDFHGR